MKAFKVLMTLAIALNATATAFAEDAPVTEVDRTIDWTAAEKAMAFQGLRTELKVLAEQLRFNPYNTWEVYKAIEAPLVTYSSQTKQPLFDQKKVANFLNDFQAYGPAIQLVGAEVVNVNVTTVKPSSEVRASLALRNYNIATGSIRTIHIVFQDRKDTASVLETNKIQYICEDFDAQIQMNNLNDASVQLALVSGTSPGLHAGVTLRSEECFQ